MSSTSPRRSKRSKPSLIHRAGPSALQVQFTRAIGAPGGIRKILHLLQTATESDIAELNTNQWTPLVGGIFRLGKNTTKNGNSMESEEQLLQLIRTCHERGISNLNGAVFGEHCHRPLVVAAYYGYFSAVRLMIELGYLVDLGDGEGRNVWHAAFDNPTASGKSHRLRDCDRQTAQTLLDMNVVTNDLGLWKAASPKASLCYMNGDSFGGSVMLQALRNKKTNVVRFLIDAGGCITDRDYLFLSRSRRSRRMYQEELLLLRMIVELNNNDENIPKSWTQQTDWSYPPTWKVGIRLCQNCGLPEDIFRSYVMPFLARDWFYNDNKKVPPRLGPSLGLKFGMYKSDSRTDGVRTWADTPEADRA